MKTTIQIEEETRDRLKDRMTKRDTYDIFLNRLLDALDKEGE